MIDMNASRITDMQEAERLDELSDNELRDLKQRYQQRVVEEKTPDLAAYQEEQERHRSLSSRVFPTFLKLLGRTPEQRFQQNLRQATSRFVTYERACDQLRERVDAQSEELTQLSEKHFGSQRLFETCQEQYLRKRQRVDRLEAELETLEQQAGDRALISLYQLREQLLHARTELRTVTHEANEAMRVYLSARDSYQALEDHHEALGERLVSFEEQRTAFGVMLNRWETERDISVGEHGPSLRQQYEDLGVLSQRVQGTLEAVLGTRPSGTLDETYRIGVRNGKEDPLVEEWLKIRE